MTQQKRGPRPKWWNCLDGIDPKTGRHWDDPWRPLGDEHSLEDVLKEIHRFAKKVELTHRREAMTGTIHDIAVSFRRAEWAEARRPRVQSRTTVRKGLQKMLVALESVRSLTFQNLDMLIEAGDEWPGGADNFFNVLDSIVNNIEDFESACRAALLKDKFRRRGRAENHHGPKFILVLRTRDLLADFAERSPGFGLETDATPGPLVRTVKAIYRYAAGQDAHDGEFDRYIVQAERYFKKN